MQVSWIDADNLNSLLARITLHEAPVPVQTPRVMEQPTALLIIPEDEPLPPAVAQPPVEEALPALQLSNIRDKLRSIRQRAHAAGMLTKSEKPDLPPSSPAQPSPRTLAPSASSRQEKLAGFATQARQILRENGGHVLVMNDDGELLWGGEAKAGLVLSAMMAWSANLRSSAKSACSSPPIMRQALASGHMLTVIPCETSTGVLLHVAVAAPAALTDEVALELRQALIRAH